MFKRIRRSMGLVTLLILIPAGILAAPVGKISHLEGEADVTGAGGKAVVLKLADPVSVGDILRTKARSKVEVTLLDGNAIWIAEKSRLKITAYENREGQKNAFDLFRGKVRAIVNSMAKQSSLELHTPTATCGVRGTIFIGYFTNGISGFVFERGEGYGFNRSMPSIIMTIGAGQAMQVIAPNKPPVVTPASAAEINRHLQDTSGSLGTTVATTTETTVPPPPPPPPPSGLSAVMRTSIVTTVPTTMATTTIRPTTVPTTTVTTVQPTTTTVSTTSSITTLPTTAPTTSIVTTTVPPTTVSTTVPTTAPTTSTSAATTVPTTSTTIASTTVPTTVSTTSTTSSSTTTVPTTVTTSVPTTTISTTVPTTTTSVVTTIAPTTTTTTPTTTVLTTVSTTVPTTVTTTVLPLTLTALESDPRGVVVSETRNESPTAGPAGWGDWQSNLVVNTAPSWIVSIYPPPGAIEKIRYWTNYSEATWSDPTRGLTGTVAGAKADWIAATTAVIGGKITGLFEPGSVWRTSSQGAWMETTAFLNKVGTMTTDAQRADFYAATNIPCFAVGATDLRGYTDLGGGSINMLYAGPQQDIDVNKGILNATFFAPTSGTRPLIWASGSVNGDFTGTPQPGNVVFLEGYRPGTQLKNGIGATFTINKWGTAVDRTWGATITDGKVPANAPGFTYPNSLTFQGGATGTIKTGLYKFGGTAAGIVK